MRAAKLFRFHVPFHNLDHPCIEDRVEEMSKGEF